MECQPPLGSYVAPLLTNLTYDPRHGDAALPGIDLKGEINKIRKSMLNLVDTCDPDVFPAESRWESR